MKAPFGVRGAALSSYHKIEEFLLPLNLADDSLGIDIIASGENDKLKALFKGIQHFEHIRAVGDENILVGQDIDVKFILHIIYAFWEALRVVGRLDKSLIQIEYYSLRLFADLSEPLLWFLSWQNLCECQRLLYLSVIVVVAILILQKQLGVYFTHLLILTDTKIQALYRWRRCIALIVHFE